MKPRSIVLALLVSLVFAPVVRADGLPTAKPEQVGLSSERLGRIGQVLRGDVERGRIPGAVVLVARKGRVAYLEAVGFRDKAVGTPMTPDAIFRIASMTKPMVTVAAMTLYEEGRLFPSDPVSKYLPGFARLQVGVERVDPSTGKSVVSTVPAEREMTIQDLMRHTSGLTYGNRGTTPIHKLYPESSNASSLPSPWTNSSIDSARRRFSTNREPRGSTACRPTSWAAWSRSSRASRSGNSPRSASSDR